MSFTTRTITHTFQNADGTAASGQITFQLSKRMSQSGTTITPGEITATLDSSGNLSQSLTANNDAGTIPQDAEWLVTFRILGESPVGPYGITVPSGTGSIDLYGLLPQQTTAG